jgi:microcin-processing metallopeptidase PmbA/TldD-like protein
LSALELAERALSHCTGEALATVVRERSLVSRFARSKPTQATQVDDTGVSILRVQDGHIGSADTNDLSDEGLRNVALRADAGARAAAAAACGRGEYPGLPAPTAEPALAHDGLDAATAALDPAAAGAALRTAFEVCAERDLEAFGVWTAGAVETAIASSAGVRVAQEVTDAYMKVTARDAAGRSGWGSGTAVAASGLDPRAISTRAAGNVTRAEPADLAPGEYPVVLEPEAVGELLDFLGFVAFNGLAHAEGRGALDGRLGTRVAAPAIALGDSPRHPGTLPRAFDFEGVPKAPLADRGRRRARRRARHALGRPSGRRRAVHRARPGPRRLELRGLSDEPGARRRRRGRRGRARRPDRARHLRHAALVRQRRAREADAADGDDARRHVPDRGRPDRPPAARRALHRLGAAHPRGDGGPHGDAAARRGGRLLRAAVRHRRGVPGAARGQLSHHRRDGLTAGAGATTRAS